MNITVPWPEAAQYIRRGYKILELKIEKKKIIATLTSPMEKKRK